MDSHLTLNTQFRMIANRPAINRQPSLVNRRRACASFPRSEPPVRNACQEPPVPVHQSTRDKQLPVSVPFHRHNFWPRNISSAEDDPHIPGQPGWAKVFIEH